MGRLTGDQINSFKNYSSDTPKTKRKYLSLKEHGESATGRILCNSASDIECYVVHRVKVGDYEREVSCLYEAGGSIDDCPFCASGREELKKRSAKIFIPFYDAETNEIKMFERPNSYYSKASGYCSRYSPIVNWPVDIVRNGEKNNPKTDYDIFPGRQPDDTTIEDILDDVGVDELPQVIGTYVLEKTRAEMEYYVQNGDFPDNAVATPRRVSRPVSAERGQATTYEDEPQPPTRRGRRTPTNNDTF